MLIWAICRACNINAPKSIKNPRKNTARTVPTPIKDLSRINNNIRKITLILKLESPKLILKYIETPSTMVEVGALPQPISKKKRCT